MNATPLRNILTARGVLSGLRDALSTHVSTADDQSLTLFQQVQQYHAVNAYLIGSFFMNVTLFGLVVWTMRFGNDDDNSKMRPWKQFSRTEVVVKCVVVFLLFWLAKNIQSAY